MFEIPDYILIAGGILVGSVILTKVLVRFPGTRLWIQTEAIKGYVYLDKLKKEGSIPEAVLPAWQAAYDALDAVIQAFDDDEITAKELRNMAYHAIGLVNEVRKLVGI